MSSADAPSLSSVLFVRGEPFVVRSRWRNGRWQELVDTGDVIVREGSAQYRFLDVVDDLALLALSEPVPHAVVVHVGVLLELAPIDPDDGNSNRKAP